MAAEKPDASRPASVEDWLRLQRRLVERAAQYFQGVGELAGEGSVEAREYIERSAKLWADVVAEFADWLKPPDVREIRRDDVILPVSRKTLTAGRAGTVEIEIPLAAFGGYEAEDTTLELWTDGLVRRSKPGETERPAAVLEPGRHLSLPPEPVRRSGSRIVELRVHGVPALLSPGDVYEGLIWAVATTKGAGDGDAPAVERRPIAVVELTIV